MLKTTMNNRTINILLIFFAMFSVVRLYADDPLKKKRYTPVVTPVVGSLVSGDHTAEGMLITLRSGRIMHIFRLDPGYEGHHIGNTGRIVKRYTDDGGMTWSLNETIFDSEFDDRNIHGGMIDSTRIVVFFRRYNAVNDSTIDLNYMYSDDDGVTWSNRITYNSEGLSSGNHKIVYVPNRGYMNIIGKSFYSEIRFSDDGIDWDSIAYRWDYLITHNYAIAEGCFSYVGDGRIIGLFRNNCYALGCNYMQVSSDDYGFSWTEPMPTNIADSFFCPSPLIFYDEKNEDVWVVAPDRRGYNYGYQHDESKLWIYRNNPLEIFNNPGEYDLFESFNRPIPTFYRLYGYPIATRKLDGNYLVVFTESAYKSNMKEEAHFFQFEIRYEASVDVPESTEENVTLNCYPNPFSESTTIEFTSNNDINEIYKLIVSDINGRIIYNTDIEVNGPGKYEYLIDFSSHDAGIYTYRLVSQSCDIRGKMICSK
ncbi:MAG: T9SS type A sorting domain-containing protein [Bacteroidota bacterium]